MRVPAAGDKTSQGGRRSAVRSAVWTGGGTLVLAGSAAIAGALLAHRFGRTARTDGFMAAYAFYIVLTLGAQSFRLVVVPDLTRAAAQDALGGELRAYAAAFLAAAVPLCVVVVAVAHPLGSLITGSLPSEAASTAASALVWLVPAAFAQLLASVFVSGLAAKDSYVVAAAAYSFGGITALTLFVVLSRTHGIVSLAWSLAASSAITLLVPLGALLIRRQLGGPAPERWEVGPRLWRLLEGAALPLALQAFYLIGLRLAAQLGVGHVTSLSYAYILAATLASTPSFALSIVSSAPLTRRGIDEEQAVEHVLHSSWVSFVLVGGAAGIFALVGGKLAELVLGSAFAGNVGSELGKLVVELAPWMAAAIVFYVTYPLLFVVGRKRLLVPLAVAALVADAAISLALREAFGMVGIVLGMAIAVVLVNAALLWSLSRRLLVLTAAGLGRLAALVAMTAGVGFGIFAATLPAIPAAVAGAVLYAGLLAAVVRLFGLHEAWAYVRALH